MSPQFVVSAGDVGRLLQVSRQFGTPTELPRRLLGLGADEGPVPTWAWITLAFGAGAIVGASCWPKVAEFLDRRGVRG